MTSERRAGHDETLATSGAAGGQPSAKAGEVGAGEGGAGSGRSEPGGEGATRQSCPHNVDEQGGRHPPG